MNATLEAPKSGLAAVKQRQQQAWASGDFAVVASRIVLAAELLCDTADLHAGWRVLDVATGSGNAAIAAARHGCRAVGVDYVPALLERGRVRAAAEGLEVELLEGDAEALPFPTPRSTRSPRSSASMFAPDHAQAASELLRVCRPGGTIALASWTPEGFIGELFRTVGAHVPPPAGVASPMLWGTEAHLRTLFGEGISSLEVAERTFTFRFTSPEEFASFFRTWYGPTLKAFEALDAPARDALERISSSSPAGPTGWTATRSPFPRPTPKPLRSLVDRTALTPIRRDRMHFHPDALRQINAARQQDMLAEAAAQRLAGSPGTRTRLAQFLRRTADRIDAATAPCGQLGPQLGPQLGSALAERG